MMAVLAMGYALGPAPEKPKKKGRSLIQKIFAKRGFNPLVHQTDVYKMSVDQLDMYKIAADQFYGRPIAKPS
jgi:hypothetical protein